MSFGELLRAYRSAAGVTQGALARRAGLSLAAVSALERGLRRAPYDASLRQLAEALALNDEERTALQRAAERGRARRAADDAAQAPTNHNLPMQLTSFVGRSTQVGAILRLCGVKRLVTLTGFGGVGKTRTVLDVAERLAANGADAVWLVELAAVNDPLLVIAKIASTLDVELREKIEAPEALAATLKERRMVLVLDCCEHVLSAVAAVARAILQSCPEITIIATSRERLGIAGEVVYRIPPLSVPDRPPRTVADGRAYSAIELFIERAESVDPGIIAEESDGEVVADICRRLDGIPLAIELAAARTTTFDLRTLRQRLQTGFADATTHRGRPERQQTMRNTLEWSFKLLSESERVLFRRVGIFHGSYTLAAAATVCADEVLSAPALTGLLISLVDKSLVNAIASNDVMRYELLDSTRAYALEHLAAVDETTVLARRHAEWMAAYAERALAAYISEPNFLWFRDVSFEIDNARAALQWALASPSEGDALLAASIAGGLRGIWLIPGRYAECRHWMQAALDRIDTTRDPIVASRLLQGLAQSAPVAETLSVYQRLIPILRTIGDEVLLMRFLGGYVVWLCQFNRIHEAREVLNELAAARFDRADMNAAYVHYASIRGEIETLEGRYDEARANILRAFHSAQHIGDEYLLNNVGRALANLEFAAGNVELAAELCEAAIERAKSIEGGDLLGFALCDYACLCLLCNEIERARDFARRVLVPKVAGEEASHSAIEHLAVVAALCERPETAARLAGFFAAWSGGYCRSLLHRKSQKLLHDSLGAQLPQDSIAQLLAEGSSMTMTIAAREALTI